MTVLEDILSQEIVQRLGWTLVHFIWQAAVVALLLVILLRLLRKSAANLRYIIACLTLALIVLLPVITIQLVPVSAPQSEQKTEFRRQRTEGGLQMVDLQSSALRPQSSVLEEPVQPESATLVSADSWKQRTVGVLEPALPYIVSGWLLGVFALSVWHLGGWAQLQRLRRRMVKQVDTSLHSKLKVLAERLRVNRTVQLVESALVQIPTVVGWLRPVILLPASALTGLSAEQLEAILAHELAHIKRFDYLLNMLQTVVEILGFYHPVVWWISHKIRAERENCCDDLAVSISGDRVCYARALTSMEEIRTGHGQLAVAATGGNLFRRIRRLLGKDSAEKTSFSWVPAVTVILLIIAFVIPTTLTLTARAQTDAVAELEEKPTKSLHQAAADGDIEQVKLLIAKGADIDAKDKKERTPLHLAVRYGHENVAKLLIAQGADVNANMRDGPWTPLLDAVSIGHTKLVKLLLEKGAKVDVGDKYGYTPLYYAIWNEDKDTVRLLLTKGADVSLKPEKDYPPLHYAVWTGDMDIVKLLVDNGAKFDVKDQDGWTAFRYASFQGSRDMVEFFVSKGADVSTFHLAACMGDLARVKDFVSQETEVDTKDELGWTPSYWALSAGQKKVFAYLLSQGANVTAKTNDGCTLLHQASKAGFTEIVKQLIAKGADVSVKEKEGETPLQHAASKGHKEIVKLLIANGADVNASSYNGKHPLGDAAYAGHEDIVKLLIASGAEVNLNAEDRGTALHAAAQGGHSTILDLLIANGADVNLNARNGTPLHSAARGLSKVKDEKSVEIVEKLLAKGADVNAKDPRQGRTPLHNTARRGNCKAAELLIAAGADVSAKDKEGFTPLWYAKDKYTMDEDDKRIVELLRRHGAIESLHDAAEGGDISQVKRLISKGADVNAKTDGWLITPMHVAAHKGHKEVCELLIAKGAEVNVKSGEVDVEDMKDAGWTPLHAACAEGRQGVAELLLAHGAAVNAKTRNSKTTPLDVAKKKGHREVVELLQKHGAEEGIPLQDRFKNAKLISSGTWLEGSFQYRTDEEWFAIDVEQNKSYLIYYDDEFGAGKYSADIETYLYKHIVDDLESKHCLFTDKHNVYHQPIKFISDYNGKLYLRLISDNPQNTTFAVKYETEE